MTFKTEQEDFWAGAFGTEYIQRNQGDSLLASNLDFFAKALRGARGIKSCIEFGANIGMNLKALNLLHPGIEAKELFLPLNQLSAQAQINDTVSVAAQYFLEWAPYRLPEGGTYLAGFDFPFAGGTDVFGTPYLGGGLA